VGGRADGPVMGSIASWLRTAESPVPLAVRAARRTAARWSARVRHRSVPAYLEQVVASVPAPPPARGRTARSTPPKIVEVSTYPLHPRQSGGQLRGWYLAEALGHEGRADVSVVSLTTDPSLAGVRELAPGLVEHCIVLPAAHVEREAALRLVTGDVALTDIASGLLWTGIAGLPDVLARELDDASASVLVQPYLVDAVRALAPGLPIVCDEHNDEHALKSGLLPSNAAGRWLLERVDRIERVAVEGASLVTATTDLDLDQLGARYDIDAPTAVVPNGVDTAGIEFVSGDARRDRGEALARELGTVPGRPTALFVGSGHGPNIAAGHDLIDVARHAPDVDFLLAGRHSSLLHTAHVPPNVRLLGPVSDDVLDLLLGGCDLALNPMRSGSGSNLKLLTYLAAGLPVISTAVGARGIDAAAAGVQIWDDAELREGVAAFAGSDHAERSLAGRHYVEEHCDWRAIGRRFAALVSEHLHV